MRSDSPGVARDRHAGGGRESRDPESIQFAVGPRVRDRRRPRHGLHGQAHVRRRSAARGVRARRRALLPQAVERLLVDGVIDAVAEHGAVLRDAWRWWAATLDGLDVSAWAVPTRLEGWD